MIRRMGKEGLNTDFLSAWDESLTRRQGDGFNAEMNSSPVTGLFVVKDMIGKMTSVADHCFLAFEISSVLVNMRTLIKSDTRRRPALSCDDSDDEHTNLRHNVPMKLCSSSESNIAQGFRSSRSRPMGCPSAQVNSNNVPETRILNPHVSIKLPTSADAPSPTCLDLTARVGSALSLVPCKSDSGILNFCCCYTRAARRSHRITHSGLIPRAYGADAPTASETTSDRARCCRDSDPRIAAGPPDSAQLRTTV